MENTLIQLSTKGRTPIILSNPNGYLCVVERGTVVGQAHGVTAIEPVAEAVEQPDCLQSCKVLCTT